MIKRFCILFFVLCSCITAYAKDIVVSKDGKGNFTSIQDAINNLSDSADAPRTIFIKKGIYDEKIFIAKHNIILKGEKRDKVIITQSIARDEWRCTNPSDSGTATINLSGNDITFINLTVINSYGFDYKKQKTITCASDTSGIKSIRPDGHQMALRTLASTRIKAINCVFRAFGGDTVSPWNKESGLFYFKDCVMEGGVDFYCPRGWAYAQGCTFIAHTGPASIWHDGSAYEDSKTVLVDCKFKGYDGFKLGRYHRDAQFYLVNCSFDKNMSDTDIYLVKTNNVIQWERRIYYYNCHRKGGDYAWHKDNFNTAKEKINPKDINAEWVFGNKWKL